MPEKKRDSMALRALTPAKETALFCLGIVMVAGSIVVFMVHATHGHLGWVDIGGHIVFVGGGFLLMVPRRVLEVLERLPKFKLFGK